MDMNAQERERGITILAKCTSLVFNNYKINIVDTPGHHDFGGEVERILSMVDGVVLVVCSTEGPMPQTKFVLQKALEHELRPIVVLNKMDRATNRKEEVENEIFDLFCSLEASDKQLEYPTLYASAKEGWVTSDIKNPRQGVSDLLETIVGHLPPPRAEESVRRGATVERREDADNADGEQRIRGEDAHREDSQRGNRSGRQVPSRRPEGQRHRNRQNLQNHQTLRNQLR